jgi:hypothetical protein
LRTRKTVPARIARTLVPTEVPKSYAYSSLPSWLLVWLPLVHVFVTSHANGIRYSESDLQ